MRYGVGQRARERKQAHKAQLRQSKFESELWQRGEGLAQRQYGTYDEYVSHQAGKLDKIIHRLKETEDEDFGEYKLLGQYKPHPDPNQELFFFGLQP